MHLLLKRYKHWRFKNTFLLLLSFVVLFYLADTPFVKSALVNFGQLGYLGAFVAGIFFVSTFTVAPAGMVLFYLAQTLTPIEVALLAGAGGVLGDYVIFRFLKDKVFEEIGPAVMRIGGFRLKHLIATPYFAWLTPVIGALIITSPFPDEIGISLLGISKLKNWQFILLSLVLNCVGIFAIITLANYL